MVQDSPPSEQAAPPAPLRLPDVPAFALSGGRGVLVTPDGEIREMARAQARGVLDQGPVMVAHAQFLAQRLGRPKPQRRPDLFDVTELFAFVLPARFCLPTPAGLSEALGLDVPEGPEDEAVALTMASHALLSLLRDMDIPHRADVAALALAMGRGGWAWGAFVAEALGEAPSGGQLAGFDVWNRMAEWEERAPQGGRSSNPVAPEIATAKLQNLLGTERSVRPGQDHYVAMASLAFAPRDVPGEPALVLAEAGTGTGKTLGYIAPSSVWADENGPGTWISTYTKNLQRQIDQELSTLYPDTDEKTRRTVIRKGRENYICLLNFEDAARRAASGLSEDTVSVGLVARWLTHSRDGDMVGGDFPSWLIPAGLVHGNAYNQGLTDRRGECIYAACPHYRKCVIEKAVRKARHAQLVVANHALVMHQAAVDRGLESERGPDTEDDGAGSGERLLRLIFDEGHHLFDAADAAFGSVLSASETAELRRWVRGAEGRSGRRGRGLPERISDLTVHDKETERLLQECLAAAAALPMEGWNARNNEPGAKGAAEVFFAFMRRHVEARAGSGDNPQFGLECAIHPVPDDLLAAATKLEESIGKLAAPLVALSTALRERLDEEAATLETATRQRIEAVCRGLDRRGLLTLPSWGSMLRALHSTTPEEFVDWFSLDRYQGRVVDIAMHRRYVDPMKAFAECVVRPSHGVLITSATLRDHDPDAEKAGEEEAERQDWESADIRTGARHMPPHIIRRTSIASPFDYAAQTRVVVVRDLAQNSNDQLASAYRELFLAAGGGALGLFTAIRRLRSVHERITGPMEEAGLPLYAQHVDAMDTGTLVDIFRAETRACLLGTDAVRDGVDVPGNSLKLIVFDKVPWPRPDLLHKARRAHFGARAYDDMLTRLKLKQAFGRLVRGPQDRGIFVLLDSRMPSRLATAFPPGVEIERMGLAEAVALTREFFTNCGEDRASLAARAAIA